MEEAAVKLCDDDLRLQAGWESFVTVVLRDAMRNCKWLLRADCNQILAGWTPPSNSARNHLANALAAWAWVFHGTGGAFEFDEVCESIGLNPWQTRKMFSNQCPHDRDINTVVRRFIANDLPGVSDIGSAEE